MKSKKRFYLWSLITLAFFLISSTTTWAKLTAIHSAPSTYKPGTDITVSNSIQYTEALTALGVSVNIPEGWTFVGVGGRNVPLTKLKMGDKGPLEFYWVNIPANPVNFTYTIHVPDNQAGVKYIYGTVLYYKMGGKLIELIQPNPLVIRNGREK